MARERDERGRRGGFDPCRVEDGVGIRRRARLDRRLQRAGLPRGRPVRRPARRLRVARERALLVQRGRRGVHLSDLLRHHGLHRRRLGRHRAEQRNGLSRRGHASRRHQCKLRCRRGLCGHAVRRPGAGGHSRGFEGQARLGVGLLSAGAGERRIESELRASLLQGRELEIVLRFAPAHPQHGLLVLGVDDAGHEHAGLRLDGFGV